MERPSLEWMSSLASLALSIAIVWWALSLQRYSVQTQRIAVVSVGGLYAILTHQLHAILTLPLILTTAASVNPGGEDA